MKPTNVDQTCSAKMMVTYPGPKGIEVIYDGKKIEGIREHLEKEGKIELPLEKNNKLLLKKYMEKYGKEAEGTDIGK